MTHLSIDVGTSAVKAAIIGDGLRIRAHATRDYPYVMSPGGHVEIDAGVLISAVVDAVSALPGDLRDDVERISYCAFSPSLVLLGKTGELAHPRIVTHLDRRSARQSAHVGEVIGFDRYLSIAGYHPFVGGSGLLTLLWMRDEVPEVLASTDHVGHLTTYLHQQLTGRVMVDLVNASMFGTYDTVGQTGWSREIIGGLGLDASWFPPILVPGTEHGALLPAPAAAMGLPAGVPVTVGTNDMAAAQVGAGNREPGDVLNTAGSSDMVSILTDRPVPRAGHYLRNAAVPGLWQIYATTSGGFAAEWFRQQFARELSATDFHEQFVSRAIEEHLADETVTFEPYLTGDRQSLEPRSGSWHGLTLAATREQMFTAMMKGSARVLADVVRRVGQDLPITSRIKITGGLVTPAHLRLKEHVFGVPFLPVRDCPLVGSVLLADPETALTT